MIKNFIFDIDGTLIDSNDFHTQVWVQAFAAYGKNISFKKIRPHMGKGADQLMPEFINRKEIKKIGKGLAKLRSEIFKRDYIPKVRPFPKVWVLSEKIRSSGGSIALASSADADDVKQYIKIARIGDLAEKSTSADDSDRSKPSPDIFRAALKLLGNPHHDTVVIIGDSPSDAKAAKKAKLRSIGIRRGGFSGKVLTANGCHAIYGDPGGISKNLKGILMHERI